MTNGNDSAFGFPAYTDPKEGRGQNLTHSKQDGLTKREYFAAMADLEEWKEASPQFMESVVGEVVPDWSKEPLAHLIFYAKFHAIIKCIKADALIKQLNKQP